MKNKILSHPAVQSLHHEDDGSYEKGGWWCYLQPGWICTESECGIIHEPTLLDVLQKLKSVTKTNKNQKL